MINEAIEALREGVATKEAIDGVMRLGMNHPMGPLELADFIGLDTCLAIMEVLHRGFGDDKYRPSPSSAAWCRRGCWAARRAGASTPTTRRGTRWVKYPTAAFAAVGAPKASP